MAPGMPRMMTPSPSSATTPYMLSSGLNPKVELDTIVKSIGLVSNDESIRSMMDVDPDFDGTCFCVPSTVQSLNIRLFFSVPPECTAFSMGISYSSTKADILKFKMNKTGAIQDTQLWLREGVTVVEFRAVLGIVDESDAARTRSYLEFTPGTEKGQTFLLVVNRF
jgi:hypothetical protein